MQAILSLSIFPYSNELGLQGVRNFTIAGALLLLATAPLAGQGERTALLEDSHLDLNLSEVVERFRQRLPREHKQDAYRLGRTIMELSERHQVSPGLLLSVIETESSFRYGVTSRAGAVGLMQLLPATAEEVARKYRIHGYQSEEDLKNPVVNLQLGVAYLAYLRGRFGNPEHYLAAYNLGPTSLHRRLSQGRYELGAISGYVKKIQGRTLALRESSSGKPQLQRRLDKQRRLGDWLEASRASVADHGL